MPILRGANRNFILEQWERVVRWKNQCDSWPKPVGQSVNAFDIYEAFFINAYHLRDWMKHWLKKNNRLDVLKQMNNDFDSKLFLKVLKDVCNGSKHFTLTQKPEIGKQYAIASEYSRDGAVSKVILIGGTKYPLNDLLADVFDYWKDFMESNGLTDLKHDITGPLIP